ncbi:hypothetical protein [Halarcobacter sp.]|uniref:hypothetical protein n=1 Tax=Halarcobacter sp. TaxID=2321133 RepID=UPI002AAA90E3|nr:hypothetical protein [Halarcobacter sp.]
MGTILLNNKKTIFLIITILFFPLIYLNFNELMKTSPNIIKEKSNKENDSNSKDIKNIQKVIRIKNIKEKNIKSVLDNYLSTKQKDKYKLLKKNHLLFIEK